MSKLTGVIAAWCAGLMLALLVMAGCEGPSSSTLWEVVYPFGAFPEPKSARIDAYATYMECRAEAARRARLWLEGGSGKNVLLNEGEVRVQGLGLVRYECRAGSRPF